MSSELRKLLFTSLSQKYLIEISYIGLFLSVTTFINMILSVFRFTEDVDQNSGFGVAFFLGMIFQTFGTIGLFIYSLSIRKGLREKKEDSINRAFKGMTVFFLFTILSIVLILVVPFLWLVFNSII